MESQRELSPSQFNMWTRTVDGTLLVYNSLSGAFMQFKGTDADNVSKILSGEAAVSFYENESELTVQGFLVPRTIDELDRARRLHESLFDRDDRLHLILIPTENCNLKCIYCYEEFNLRRMRREVMSSVVSFIQQQASKLHSLSIGWFGGEPLLGIDIIDEISHQVLAICKENHIYYSSSMATNGYLLTDQLLERCFSAQISTFQITLDGPAEIHNKLRPLAGGGETFNTILTNLLHVREKDDNFHIRIRVNFTPDTIMHIPQFLRFMGNEFGGDPRFSIYFRPVGQWGGEQSAMIRTCDRVTGMSHEVELMSLAFQEGFSLNAWEDLMQPFGCMCYAADPHSFVIGAGGTIYKCTVAFDDPRNQIGQLTAEGTLHINEQLHNLWIRSGETNTECQMCAFYPPCQGNICPLSRFKAHENRCPLVKTHLDKCLPLLATAAIASIKRGRSHNY